MSKFCQKIACCIVIPSIPGRFYPSSTATQNREREKKGQASLRFNCAFLLSNSVAVKWTAGGGAAHMCDVALGRQGCAPRARADVPLPCMLLLCRPLKHCNNVVCWPVFYYVQEKVKLAPDDFDPLAYFYCLTRALSNKV